MKPVGTAGDLICPTLECCCRTPSKACGKLLMIEADLAIGYGPMPCDESW